MSEVSAALERVASKIDRRVRVLSVRRYLWRGVATIAAFGGFCTATYLLGYWGGADSRGVDAPIGLAVAALASGYAVRLVAEWAAIRSPGLVGSISKEGLESSLGDKAVTKLAEAEEKLRDEAVFLRWNWVALLPFIVALIALALILSPTTWPLPVELMALLGFLIVGAFALGCLAGERHISLYNERCMEQVFQRIEIALLTDAAAATSIRQNAALARALFRVDRKLSRFGDGRPQR